jgi:hypothetical protein
MVFVNCQLGGLNLAFPDVCMTPIPTPVGPIPVPLPYPNISTGITALPFTAALRCLIMAMPAHNLMTITPMSMGDNTGIMLGLLSGMVMGPTRHLFGSTNVLMGGLPVTKMLSPSGQNGFSPNTIGLALAPSQVKVISLR